MSVVDLDGVAARALARREIALYLPVVAELDPTLTLDPDLVAAIRAAAAHYDFDQAARLISDDLLRKFAFAGTPDEVAEQAHSHFAAGAGRVDVDVVDAGTRAGDCPQLRRRRDDFWRHLGRTANDERVGVGEIRLQLIGGAAGACVDGPSLGAKQVEGGGGQVVSNYDVHRVSSPG